MARSHREIVGQAGRMLRLRGVQGTSVADLMQACGLTHGGFYRHFASKDALIAEATEAVIEDMLGPFEALAESRGPRSALEAYIKRYLSEDHVLNPDMGCPVSSYAIEVMRETPAASQSMVEGIDRIRRLIANGLGGSGAESDAAARSLFAQLVGAVVTARSVAGASEMRRVLQANRQAAQRVLDDFGPRG